MSDPEKKPETTDNGTAPEVTSNTPESDNAPAVPPVAPADGIAAPANTIAAPANTNDASAPVNTANDNAEDAPVPAKPGISRKKKILSAAFNMAAGAAVTAAAKMAVVAVMSWTAAPAVATLLVSSLAVGIASATFCHLGQVRAAKKAGTVAPKFWRAATAKTALKSGAFALVGGALFLGFSEGIIQNFLGFGHHAAVAPVVTAPAVTHIAPPVETHVVAPVVAPVEHVTQAVIAPPVHCPTPGEQFADLIKGHHVSAQVQDAIHRAASGNAHVAAQGAKDLGFYAQNGLGGVPKDPHIAVELFKQAADAGNVQARVDLLYLQHHGLDTITPDKTASLSAMKDIAHNARATHFVEQWGGAGKTLPHVDFNTDTILKGVKLACPKV